MTDTQTDNAKSSDKDFDYPIRDADIERSQLLIGHDVAGTHPLNPAAAVEVLALAEEVAGLLRICDGQAAHGCYGK